MKIKIIIVISILLHGNARAQVGVNILTPHSSAAMQIESPQGSVRGLLTPSVTTTMRMSMTTGTNTAADGLLVYDVNHRMHYHYNGALNRWVSHSPFTLSTPTVGSSGIPSGVITTPSSTAVFSVGINKQNPAQALDVVGNAAVAGNLAVSGNISNTGSISTNQIKVPGFSVNALVPVGTIVMWHGSTIPAGWVECNGANGTPDLRGRFIVAAGQAPFTSVPGDLNPVYPVNSTGGENRHTLTKSEIPRHHHQAVGDGATIMAAGGSHRHSASPHGQGTGAQRAGGNSGGLASDSQASINTSYENHSHPNSEFSGRVGDGTADGLNNQPHENRPAYYALRFIMKQ